MTAYPDRVKYPQTTTGPHKGFKFNNSDIYTRSMIKPQNFAKCSRVRDHVIRLLCLKFGSESHKNFSFTIEDQLHMV